MNFKAFFNFLKQNKYLAFMLGAITIFIAIFIVRSVRNPDKTEEYYEDYSEQSQLLEEVALQELTTKEDIVVPEPTKEASSDFKQYNQLEFKDIVCEKGQLSFELYNNSDKTITSPYITVFEEDDPNELSVVDLVDQKILSKQSIKVVKVLDNITKPKILRYIYFTTKDGEQQTVTVDLKNGAAYSYTESDAANEEAYP